METLGRTQSERRRRLALAGGFRLLRSSGIDRLDAPAHAVGAGRQAQMTEDFDNHRRIIDGGDDLQSAAAVGTVFHVDGEDAFEQPGPADARRRALCVRALA